MSKREQISNLNPMQQKIYTKEPKSKTQKKNENRVKKKSTKFTNFSYAHVVEKTSLWILRRG